MTCSNSPPKKNWDPPPPQMLGTGLAPGGMSMELGPCRTMLLEGCTRACGRSYAGDACWHPFGANLSLLG